MPNTGRPPSYKSCAMVGNARSLLAAELGAEIDKHAAVFRINQGPTIGFERFVGNKTTHRMVNHKWAQAYRGNVNLQLEHGIMLLVSRTPWNEFLKTAHSVRERRPDVQLRLLTREGVDRAGDILRALKLRIEQVRGLPYAGKGSPSSGFVGVHMLLQMCKKVSIYGMGDGVVGSWHYFEGRKFKRSREFSADPHHSFELEHDIMQVLDEAGLLKHHRIVINETTAARLASRRRPSAGATRAGG